MRGENEKRKEGVEGKGKARKKGKGEMGGEVRSEK